MADLLLAILLALAVVWDLRERRIPNALTITGIILALFVRGFAGVDAVWSGITGCLFAGLVAIPFFVAGGLGGGDVKLLAAVGAFLGPAELVPALLATAVVGGAIAVFVAWRNGALRDVLGRTAGLVKSVLGRGGEPPRTLSTPGALSIPYAVPIAVGALYATFV